MKLYVCILMMSAVLYTEQHIYMRNTVLCVQYSVVLYLNSALTRLSRLGSAPLGACVQGSDFSQFTYSWHLNFVLI